MGDVSHNLVRSISWENFFIILCFQALKSQLPPPT